MRIEMVVAACGAEAPALLDWIARGWLAPQGAPPDWEFTDADVARARLVRTLLVEGGVEQDSVELVLSLLDQVHALRHGLRVVAEALAEQPEPVRRAVLARLLG